jgi:Tfp pilus assembly protein PilV
MKILESMNEERRKIRSYKNLSSLFVIISVTLLMIAYILCKPLETIKAEDQNILATLSSDLADKLRADPFYEAMREYD